MAVIHELCHILLLYINQITEEMLEPATGEYLRHRIWDNQTHDNQSYYGDFFMKVDHGTSHLSVLAPNGDAVSLTSTINYRFETFRKAAVLIHLFTRKSQTGLMPGHGSHNLEKSSSLKYAWKVLEFKDKVNLRILSVSYFRVSYIFLTWNCLSAIISLEQVGNLGEESWRVSTSDQR